MRYPLWDYYLGFNICLENGIKNAYQISIPFIPQIQKIKTKIKRYREAALAP